MRAWHKFLTKNVPPSSLWEKNIEIAQELGLTELALQKIREKEEQSWAEKEVEKCQNLGLKISTYLDGDYPKSLLILNDAPLLLYWKGNVNHIMGPTIGVVGTRKSTFYGKKVAQNIGVNCSKAGISLISGGAYGIDGIAHDSVCKSGGSTFAVLGNGVNIVYPSSNSLLFEKICEKGALISEFPVDAKATTWSFPKRNRLVAALSDKLIVVEAPLKSGAMITARLATELGKEVWSVPGQINEFTSEGCNRLIFDGAFPYINDEIFWGIQKEQNLLQGSSLSLEEIKKEELTPEEVLIINFLRSSGGHTIDNIANEVKMSAASVLKIIALLSAKEIVCSSAPGRYSISI